MCTFEVDSSSFFKKNSVCVVDDLMYSFCFILGISSTPPYFANICCMSPLNIRPNLPGSLRAFMSCSPMHCTYAFVSENASSSNTSCGSCVITFAVQFGNLHVTFWIPMTFIIKFF